MSVIIIVIGDFASIWFPKLLFNFGHQNTAYNWLVIYQEFIKNINKYLLCEKTFRNTALTNQITLWMKAEMQKITHLLNILFQYSFDGVY